MLRSQHPLQHVFKQTLKRLCKCTYMSFELLLSKVLQSWITTQVFVNYWALCAAIEHALKVKPTRPIRDLDFIGGLCSTRII